MRKPNRLEEWLHTVSHDLKSVVVPEALTVFAECACIARATSPGSCDPRSVVPKPDPNYVVERHGFAFVHTTCGDVIAKHAGYYDPTMNHMHDECWAQCPDGPFHGSLIGANRAVGHAVTKPVPPGVDGKLPCGCPMYNPPGTGTLITYVPGPGYNRFQCEQGHRFDWPVDSINP